VVWLFLIGFSAVAADEPIVPPAIEFSAPIFPILLAPAAYIPDIPWLPPSPRLNAKTPFAPTFLKGNNIFTGEKEYWLADAVAGTELGWPRKFTDPLICTYLSRLAQNLGQYSNEPNKHYQITVINVPLPNAFTAGGGRVYITRGMLRQVNNEDELAGVIAHEIGHDNFHHAGRTLTRQFYWLIGVRQVNSYHEMKRDLAKFLSVYEPEHNPFPALGEAISGIPRADEQSADKAAFYFLYRAGYNPLALAEFFDRVPDPMLQSLKSEVGGAWPVFWTLSVLLDSHPPNGLREMAINWESNFVGPIPRDSQADPTAFNFMKARLMYLDEEDARNAREAREKTKTLKRKAEPAPAPPTRIPKP